MDEPRTEWDEMMEVIDKGGVVQLRYGDEAERRETTTTLRRHAALWNFKLSIDAGGGYLYAQLKEEKKPKSKRKDKNTAESKSKFKSSFGS